MRKIQELKREENDIQEIVDKLNDVISSYNDLFDKFELQYK